VRFDERARPGFSVRAEVLTWDLCVFRLCDEHSGATAYTSRRGPAVEQFLQDLDAGRLDRTLAAVLARPPRRRLRRPPRGTAWPGPHVGIEHEFRVLDPSGKPVDVRRFLHRLGIDGVRADPGDPNAYRCGWGGVITSDGPEVELATPPFPLEPGVVERVVTSAERGRSAVEAVLPPGHHLDGYSTHVSVSQGQRRDDAVARRYAQSYGPPMMLLLDRVTSPGLLVRPRPGRLELCGEFVDGDHLRAAVAFAAGSALAVRRRRQARHLFVELALEPAVERYGWFVDRRAFGEDLYESGRATLLRRRAGVVTAGEHLADSWAAARPSVRRLLSDEDLDAVDRAVDGRRSLPCEGVYSGTASMT
jgi:hypothetical protein